MSIGRKRSLRVLARRGRTGYIFRNILERKASDWVTKTIDAFLIHSQKPVVGSVLYCNLALAFEHSGIYIGNGKVVHLDGQGVIEAVSLKQFVNRLDGSNPSVSIFCATDCNGKAIGSKEAAERAIKMIGKRTSYNLALNNCHGFTAYCLTGSRRQVGSFANIERILSRNFKFARWRAIDMEIKNIRKED